MDDACGRREDGPIWPTHVPHVPPTSAQSAVLFHVVAAVVSGRHIELYLWCRTKLESSNLRLSSHHRASLYKQSYDDPRMVVQYIDVYVSTITK